MRVYAGTNHSIPPKSCTTKGLKRQVQNMINGPDYMQVYERSLACMIDRYGNRKCPLTPTIGTP
nr:MAG TPA: hypothetical protein [Caudoviricetes sp.]